MEAAEINYKLVDFYYTLLKNLSPDNKLELISRLSDSMKNKKKVKDDSWKALFGALILDQAADEFIDELKKDRNFTRKRAEI